MGDSFWIGFHADDMISTVIQVEERCFSAPSTQVQHGFAHREIGYMPHLQLILYIRTMDRSHREGIKV